MELKHLKVILFLFLLVCSLFLFINPSVNAKTELGTETLWVNGYTEEEIDTGWAKVGSSPYLSDEDASNYVHCTNVYSAYIRYWDFADLSQSSVAIDKAIISIYADRLAGDSCVVYLYLWDGSSYVSCGASITLTTTYTWYNRTVTSILNTAEKVNNARLRIRYQAGASGAHGYVSASKLYVTKARYDISLRTVDSNSSILISANVTINNGTEYSQIVDNNGWANWTGIYSSSVSVTVKYQDVWVNSTTVTMSSDKTVDLICEVYSLTVYVTDANNEEKSGASLTLTRTDEYNYTSDGLSPVTAAYYNSTHARYIWTQLANQTSSYTVTASLGGQSAYTSTNLTANTVKVITLPAGTSSPTGGGSSPAPPPLIPELPFIPRAPELPVEAYEILPWTAIIVVVSIIAIPVVAAKQLSTEKKSKLKPYKRKRSKTFKLYKRKKR